MRSRYGFAYSSFYAVILSFAWVCDVPIGMKTSVILSERSESKDPYVAHSLSPDTFFDGVE